MQNITSPVSTLRQLDRYNPLQWYWNMHLSCLTEIHDWLIDWTWDSGYILFRTILLGLCGSSWRFSIHSEYSNKYTKTLGLQISAHNHTKPFGVILPKLFPILPHCAIKLLIGLHFPHFPLCWTLNLTSFQLLELPLSRTYCYCKTRGKDMSLSRILGSYYKLP